MKFIFILLWAVTSWTNLARGNTATCAADDKICYLKNLCPQEDSPRFKTQPNTWIITVTSDETNSPAAFVRALDKVFEFAQFYHTTGYLKSSSTDGMISRSFVVSFEETYYKNSLPLLTPEQQTTFISRYSLDVFFTKMLSLNDVTVMCSRSPYFTGGHTSSN